MGLEGRAKVWFQWWKPRNPTSTWEEFRSAVLQRFHCPVQGDPYEALKPLLTNLKEKDKKEEKRSREEGVLTTGHNGIGVKAGRQRVMSVKEFLGKTRVIAGMEKEAKNDSGLRMEKEAENDSCLKKEIENENICMVEKEHDQDPNIEQNEKEKEEKKEEKGGGNPEKEKEEGEGK